MNLKIDQNDLRFKISEEELNALLKGQSLSTEASIAKTVFAVTIAVNANESGVRIETNERRVMLCLWVTPDQLKNLSDLGRSRAGLRQQSGDVCVTLQVDVREDSRKSRSKAA